MKRRTFVKSLGLAALSITPIARFAGCQTVGDPTDSTAPVCALTTGDAQGPFFLPNAPNTAVLGAGLEDVSRLHLRGQILGSDCGSLGSGYRVDVWHADAGGNYHMEGDSAYLYRGLLSTDDDGRFEIETIRPGNYSIGADYMRPAHYHFKVYQPNGSELVTTQFYFDDDPYLAAEDGCQPNTCNSYDSARYLHLVTGSGGMAQADLRIIV